MGERALIDIILFYNFTFSRNTCNRVIFSNRKGKFLTNSDFPLSSILHFLSFKRHTKRHKKLSYL